MFLLQKDKQRKPVSYSAIENQKIKLFEKDMSPHGLIFGGRILEIVEKYAQKVANKHADMKCKTAGISSVKMFAQAKRGDILICKASVNRVWNISMEVGIKILAEDFRTLEKKHILSAYFTFEAFDEKVNPVEIADIICETENQKRRFKDSQKRKDKR